ncbi:MAG: uracil phosphoribosyltransferase [Bacteroidales bacterium]|nr:uracil phosphoribosyltransferase [Bacteroidales bacterium]
MKVINLGETNSIINTFVAQMRDKDIQKDSMRFRRNLERLGEIFAYEISKTMSYSTKNVVTPLGIAEVPTFDDQVVLATILRAGLPLHQGVLNYFDGAQNGFIAAYRKTDKGNKFHINFEYAALPSTEGKTLIIADTMLATGSSILIAYNKILEEGGKPQHTHFVCPISSVAAIEKLSKELQGEPVTVWVAAIDPELTLKSYIVPGLGDAGDLAFGEKR